MGKRKEKGGRRQILQLDDEAPTHNYASGTAWPSYIPQPDQCLPDETEEDKKGNANPLSGLLSHYMNSEDEESDEDEPPGVAESTSQQVDSQSPKHMDVEVADFLKEIDSIKVDRGEAVPTKKKQEDGKPPEAATSRLKVAEKQSVASPERAVPTTSWQECYDESSGYTYFWNMLTNEVTWDCPEEHRLYLESLASQVGANSQQESTNASRSSSKSPTAPAAPSVSRRVEGKKVAASPSTPAERSDEPSPSDDEGKMEPITFYGPSSSDSSDSESESPAKSIKAPLQYGPQLPPSTYEQPNQNPVEFGPQLPSDLAESEPDSAQSPEDGSAPNIEPKSDEAEFAPDVDPNLDMPPAEAMIRSPETTSPLPMACNEVTSRMASRSSSEEGEVVGDCNSGPSLLHLSYLEDVDEPDSTTLPQPVPLENESAVQSIFIGPLHTPQVLLTAEAEQEAPQMLASPKPSASILPENMETHVDTSDTEDHQLVCEQLPVVANTDPLLPSTYYEDESSDAPPARRGFGFAKKEPTPEKVLDVSTKVHRSTRHSKKKKSAISFVKAETLDLTELNRHVAAEWSVATSDVASKSPSSEDVANAETLPVFGPHPENGTTSDVDAGASKARTVPFIGPALPPDDQFAASEALPAAEADPSSDMLDIDDIDDIDEIDRALDLALERKRAAQVASQNGVNMTDEADSEADTQDLSSDEDKVAQLSLTILERFAHAGITSDSVPHLQTLYVQTKTRLEDWRCGALDSLYLLRCLKETERETWRRGLLGAVSSSDRDCRASKRLRTDDSFLEPDTTRQNERRRKTADVSPPSCANSVSSSTGPTSFLPTIVEQVLYAPPPPPPPTPPPDSPPPPPPDSTDTTEADVAEVDEPEDKTEQAEEPESLPNSLEEPVDADPAPHLSPTYSTGIAAPAMIARPPVPVVADELQMQLSSFYSDLTALSASDPPSATSPPPPPTPQADPLSKDIRGGVRAGSATSSPAGTKHAAPPSSRKEKKLKKARMAPGLVLKKKNIPSLVEKWRKIKQEQALAESSSEDEGHAAGAMPPD